MSGYIALVVIGILFILFGNICKKLDREPPETFETTGTISGAHREHGSSGTYYNLIIKVDDSLQVARSVTYCRGKTFRAGEFVVVGAYRTETGAYRVRIRDSRLVRSSEDVSKSSGWLSAAGCLFMVFAAAGIITCLI